MVKTTNLLRKLLVFWERKSKSEIRSLKTANHSHHSKLKGNLLLSLFCKERQQRITHGCSILKSDESKSLTVAPIPNPGNTALLAQTHKKLPNILYLWCSWCKLIYYVMFPNFFYLNIFRTFSNFWKKFLISLEICLNIWKLFWICLEIVPNVWNFLKIYLEIFLSFGKDSQQV